MSKKSNADNILKAREILNGGAPRWYAIKRRVFCNGCATPLNYTMNDQLNNELPFVKWDTEGEGRLNLCHDCNANIMRCDVCETVPKKLWWVIIHHEELGCEVETCENCADELRYETNKIDPDNPPRITQQETATTRW